MGQTILNQFQQNFLALFKTTGFAKKYYLSGGTALAEFYLQHRYSKDLDFFTQDEQNLDQLKKFIHHVAKKSNIKKTDFQSGFGLYTFFLHDQRGIKHKIDFGQYPFEPIEKLKLFNGIFVESLYDIGVNKAQTIVIRPRLRDFIDLYFILREKKTWKFQELLKKSFEKFEIKVDVLQVGENLLEVKRLKDRPLMIKKINIKEMREFFLNEAKKLSRSIWKKP